MWDKGTKTTNSNNPSSVRSSAGTSLAMSTGASLMSYIRTQTCLLGSNLTCRESIPALSATSSPFVPRKNRYHRRNGRWEKNDTKLLKKKWTNSSMPTSSENSDIPPGSPTFSWSKGQQQMANVHQLYWSKQGMLQRCITSPNIDRLVDGTFGFQMLSFLNAYSRYNQIRMHAPDKEKMTFITKDPNFCDRVMPFCLKNASATN